MDECVVENIQSRNQWVIDRLKEDFPKPEYKINTSVFDWGNSFAVCVENIKSQPKTKRHAFLLELIEPGGYQEYVKRGINYAEDKEDCYQRMVQQIRNQINDS